MTNIARSNSSQSLINATFRKVSEMRLEQLPTGMNIRFIMDKDRLTQDEKNKPADNLSPLMNALRSFVEGHGIKVDSSSAGCFDSRDPKAEYSVSITVPLTEIEKIESLQSQALAMTSHKRIALE